MNRKEDISHPVIKDVNHPVIHLPASTGGVYVTSQPNATPPNMTSSPRVTSQRPGRLSPLEDATTHGDETERRRKKKKRKKKKHQEPWEVEPDDGDATHRSDYTARADPQNGYDRSHGVYP